MEGRHKRSNKQTYHFPDRFRRWPTCLGHREKHVVGPIARCEPEDRPKTNERQINPVELINHGGYAAASGYQREPAKEPTDHQAAIDGVRSPKFDHPEQNAKDSEARDKPKKTIGAEQANLQCIAGCHQQKTTGQPKHQPMTAA